ncbi:MAG: type II secretion system F family protein [Alphaproteobacteria bacterium]|nr:MAG: type II secretion system F family protein [Alphaproteobacteria bacterium]
MPTYRFVAFSSDGRKTRGAVEAGTLLEARRQLRDRQLSIVELLEGSSSVEKNSFFTSFKRGIDYARLFSDLAVLLNAGLGIDQAVRAIRDAGQGGRQQQVLQELLGQLTAGASPSSAFSRLPNLPSDVLALIVSGEKVARLPHVMTLIGSELARRQSQRKELVDALIYPVFLLVMMAFAVGVLSFVLVPSLEPIFESSGRAPPMIVGLLGNLRTVLTQPAIIVALTSVIVLSVAIAALRPAATKRIATGVMLRTPLFGSVISRITIARYLQNLSLLLDNSVALPDALKITADGCAITSYRVRLAVVRDMVISGKSVLEAFTSVNLMPSGVLSLIAIGDEVNRLGPVLAGASNALQLDAQRTLERATTMLTPIITIVLGALVGSLVISVMSALLSINELSLS